MLKINSFLFASLFFSINTQAQSMEGLWQGHFLSSNGGIPQDIAFRWDAENNWGIYFYNSETWTSFNAELQITGDYANLGGTYTVEDKNNVENWGKFDFLGHFNFDTKEFSWQPQRWLEGSLSTIGKTTDRRLRYSQEGNYEYIRGRWTTSDGNMGVMECRRNYSGIALRSDKVEPTPIPVPIPEPIPVPITTVLEASEMKGIGFDFPRYWMNNRDDTRHIFTSIKPDNSLIFSIQRAGMSNEEHLLSQLANNHLLPLGITNPQQTSMIQVNRTQQGLAISKEVRFTGYYAGQAVDIFVQFAKVKFWGSAEHPMLIIMVGMPNAAVKEAVLINNLLNSYKRAG